MILTQTYAGIGSPTNMEPVDAYFDEVELTDAHSGYGLTREAHVKELKKRSGDRTVLNATFTFRPGRSHPSYGTIVATVLGDEYRFKQPG